MQWKYHNLFIKIKDLVVIAIAPIFFTIVFGWVYSNIYVQDIPVIVYDMDMSTISREIIENIDDSEGLVVEMTADSQNEVKDAILRGEVKAGFIIPDDFGEGIIDNKSPRALVLIDGVNLVIGNNVAAYASTVFNTMNAGIQTNLLEAGEIVPYIAQQNITTLTFVDRMLYDPQLGYYRYVFAGLLGVFVQQTYLAIIVPLFIREKSRLKKLPGTIEYKKAGFKNLILQVLEFAGLTYASTLTCLIIANRIFQYPIRGDLGLTLLIHTLFLINLTAMALILAAVFENEVHCIQFIMFLSVPTMLTSGCVWPEFAMAPHFGAFIKSIWPLYYYVNPMRDLQVKGAAFSGIENYIFESIIFALFWIPVSIWIYKHKIRKVKQITATYKFEEKMT